MNKHPVALALAVIAVPAIARDCPELKPSLHEYRIQQYRIQQYGRAYVAGKLALGPIKDGEHCEKLRRDLGVYRCLWRKARAEATLPHVRREDPARFERAVARMWAQRPHGLRVIAQIKERGCRVPPPPRVR
ncbi:MAG: hypothetical protein OXF79_21745 [Chloroflexi bacterium]|nr:hypothetical protein [Chloroflexota bacterium]